MCAFATSDMYSVEDYLNPAPMQTKCATSIFNEALAKNAKNMIEDPELASTTEIDTWAHFAFSQPDVLSAVLKCPELTSLGEDDSIIFEPISYTFSNGRTIEINYETTKKTLEQRLKLAYKPNVAGGEINPDIFKDSEQGNVWVNVDPAWYAILVAEHGSMDPYVGDDKNNILSLKYIQNNIDKFYPVDHFSNIFHADCTSKTAIAGDTDMINIAASKSVGGVSKKYKPETDAEKDQAKLAKNNDFYVMGDGDLRFITALEIVADIVLTVVTWGGAAAAKGVIQALRMGRALKKSQKAIKALRASRDVTKWTKASKRTTDVQRAIKNVDNIEDSYRTISNIERTSTQTVKNLTHKRDLLKARKAKSKTIKSVEKELEIAQKQAKATQESTATAEKLRKMEQTLKEGKLGPDETKKLEKEMEELKKTYSKQLDKLNDLHANELKQLEKTKDVKNYKKVSEAQREVAHNLYMLRQGKIALQSKRGILPVRAYRSWKALRTGLKGAKKSGKAVKAIRAGTSGFVNRVNDMLFHNTLKTLSAIATVPAAIQTAKVVLKIFADSYDYTDISTSEYTNGIDMQPYLLLGADDIPNYENVVNHGMWMFWTGSSTSAADDDAAYLQAMSFAEKFHQDLVETQDEYNVMSCDVDIYVVRPIIRNPGTDGAELYYLFMNTTPWTTHDYNEPNDGSQPALIAKRADDENQSNGSGSAASLNEQSPNGQPTESNSTPTTSTQLESSGAFINDNSIINTDGGTTRTANRIGTYTEPLYDGSRTGQPCTKPTKNAGVYTNEILTTGRYATISPAFEKAMITKFRTEGGCGEHPADPAGYTCYGVSSKYFPQVKDPNFSRADAEDIAYNSFFKKHNIDKLPDAISGDVFMALWGTGSKQRSIGLLQELLGVEKTGIIDDATINAARNYKGDDLRSKFLDRREAEFRNATPDFRQGLANGLDVYRANGCHTVAQETIP